MKPLLIALTFVANGAFATEPSDAVVKSCLGGEAVSSKLAYRPLRTQEVLSQDEYKPGYNATYYVEIDGKDIGYAEGESNHAIIYYGRLYPLNSAIAINENYNQQETIQFNPYLAEWSFIQEKRNLYLCTSFNFDGIGRSGNYQKVRGGYFLEVSRKKRKLYFGMLMLQSKN